MPPYLEERPNQHARQREQRSRSRDASRDVSSDSESENELPEGADEMELLAGYALGSHHSHQGNRKLLNGRRLAKALLALLAVSLCGILAVRFSLAEGHSGANSRIKHDIAEFTVGTRFHRSVYKVAIALEPALRTIDGVELAYQVPPREPIGVLVTAHGCAHRGTDFWEPSPKSCPHCLGLPSETFITRVALARGFVVVGVSSQDVESKCWETDLDGAMVQKAVPKLLAEIGKESLPIVALGASSGGAFATRLPMFLPNVVAINEQIAGWPSEGSVRDRGLLKHKLRAVVFTHMPQRDPERAALVADGVRQLNAVKMPVLEQRVTPAALSETYFYDRLDGMDKATAAKFFRLLKENDFLEADNTLKRNPRNSKWRDMVREHLPGYARTDPLELDLSPLSEVMNVAFARHELVGELFEETLDFVCNSGAIDNCY